MCAHVNPAWTGLARARISLLEEPPAKTDDLSVLGLSP